MHRPSALLLTLLLLAAACGGGGLDEQAGGPEIFSATCARCHAADLSGGIGPRLGMGAPSSDKPLEYFVQTISRGQGRMPSFDGSLSANQIQRVVEFILVEQGREFTE